MAAAERIVRRWHNIHVLEDLTDFPNQSENWFRAEQMKQKCVTFKSGAIKATGTNGNTSTKWFKYMMYTCLTFHYV